MSDGPTIPAATVVFHRETYATACDDMAPLLAAGSTTICEPQGLPPLRLDDRLYRIAENAGALRVYTARLDGEMIGFAVFKVRENPHHVGSLWAHSDMIWTTPDARRPTVGLRLMRGAEDALRAEGVQVVQIGTKLAHPALGRLLSYMGYEPVETIYQKVA